MTNSLRGSARSKEFSRYSKLDDEDALQFMSQDSIYLAKSIQAFLDALTEEIKLLRSKSKGTKRHRLFQRASFLCRVDRMRFIMNHADVPPRILQIYFPVTKAMISQYMTGNGVPPSFKSYWRRQKRLIEYGELLDER